MSRIAPVGDEILTSCAAVVEGIVQHRFGAVDVVEAALTRIESVNCVVNAICTPTASAALAAARECDRRIAAGEPARPLEGVPFTVKDVLPTKGIRTTYGSTLFRDDVSRVDAAAVTLLKSAGAVMLGKTNTPEFASDPLCNTHNEVFGVTRNPWDPNRTVGASSGGAAAGLAARMTPLALGTDLGGSIRGPSSVCGVVGLRPTPGRVPDWPDEAAWNFPVAQVVGPMALDVDGVQRAFAVLTGGLATVQATPAGRGPVAFTTDFGGVLPVDPEVAAAVRQAARRFEALGYDVEEACPAISGVESIVARMRPFGMLLRYGHLAARPGLTGAVRAMLERAAATPAGAFADAERHRQAYAHAFGSFMTRYCLLLTPAWASTAYRLDTPLDTQVHEWGLAMYLRSILYTYAVTLAGLPSMSVPCGLDRQGLPIGVQLAGRPGGDEDLLAAAAAYEAARGAFPAAPELREGDVRPMDPSFRRDGMPPTSVSVLES